MFELGVVVFNFEHPGFWFVFVTYAIMYFCMPKRARIGFGIATIGAILYMFFGTHRPGNGEHIFVGAILAWAILITACMSPAAIIGMIIGYKHAK